jgi:carboxypeptidase family protein
MRTQYIAVLAIVALVRSAGMVLAAPPASSGTVSGKVTYTGTPPKMKPIDMAKEPSCAAQHATPVTTENVVTGLGNALQHVVVYISAGDQGSSVDTQVVRFDQKGCQYIPHVGVMQVNLPLEVHNNDQVSHNMQAVAKVNRGWNKAQLPGMVVRATFVKPEFIPVKCDEHPWMHAYFVVLGTSHYAVTDDDGGFSLKGLPPGKYTVTAWHEQFGTESQDVTISGSETKTISFVFRATPY